ncbi:MAG: hypothetical protein ITG00_07430 [Flavobacterium sp.]|nr:hypothetical protein [Flavobacterium sp.]
MKKLVKYIVGLLLFSLAAQGQVSVNINTGPAPSWGPAGYSNATYYYLPDVETYYDVRRREYVYLKQSKWVRSSSLPLAYRQYDLYNGYKVVFTHADPYRSFATHKVKYKKGYKGKPQKNIGNNGKGNGKVGHPGYKGPKNNHSHSAKKSPGNKKGHSGKGKGNNK